MALASATRELDGLLAGLERLPGAPAAALRVDPDDPWAAARTPPPGVFKVGGTQRREPERASPSPPFPALARPRGGEPMEPPPGRADLLLPPPPTNPPHGAVASPPRRCGSRRRGT